MVCVYWYLVSLSERVSEKGQEGAAGEEGAAGDEGAAGEEGAAGRCDVGY